MRVAYPASLVSRRSAGPAPARRCTHLLDDDDVDADVENGHHEAGEDDGGEVEEHEVVVVHDAREETGWVWAGVPAHHRQQSDHGAQHPAADYDTCSIETQHTDASIS